jgi:uncharacterized membrane protein
LPIDGLVIYKLCNPTHACHESSLSLLSQAVLTSILAWLFLDEKLQLYIIGGLILLGIRHFYEYTLDKNTKNRLLWN